MRVMSTNLSPSMIAAVSLSGINIECTPVNVSDLCGEKFYDSLSNNGVRGYMNKNGVEFLKNEEGDKPLHFQLAMGDELYLVMDMPGSRTKKIPDFKDEDDLPELVRPIIIRMRVSPLLT